MTTKAAAEPASSVAPPSARKRSARSQPRQRSKDRRGGTKWATRLNRKIVDTIVEQLEQGAPIKGAAAVAGLPARTFYECLARGVNGSGTPLERELATAVEMAMDRAQATGAVSLWNDGDWRARLAVMERRWPDQWAPRKVVQLGNADGKPFAVVSADELEGVAQRALLEFAQEVRQKLRQLEEGVVDVEAVELPDEAAA